MEYRGYLVNSGKEQYSNDPIHYREVRVGARFELKVWMRCTKSLKPHKELEQASGMRQKQADQSDPDRKISREAVEVCNSRCALHSYPGAMIVVKIHSVPDRKLADWGQQRRKRHQTITVSGAIGSYQEREM